VGDAGFWASMHRYLADHAYGDVDTEDLRRACEAATGQSLGWFFDEWAYSGGYPSFAVSDSYDPSAKTVSVTIAETQKEDPVTQTLAVYRMPVDIEIMTDSGDTTQRVEITQAQQTLVLPCKSEPRDVIFDPKGWLLKTVDFSKGRSELIWQLLHAGDVGPRLDAIEGFADNKDQPAVETALATALETDTSPAVRAACALALAGMTVGSPESELLTEGRMEADISVREAIVRALGSYSDAPAKAEVALALTDPHYGLQEAAIDAAQAQKDTALLPAIRMVIASSNTDSAYDPVRAAAVRVLLARPGPQQLADARRYTGADQPRVIRMAAIRSLSTIGPGNRAVTAFLVHLLSDPSPLVRRVAVASLADRKDPGALAALNALAADPHTDARLKDAATAAVQAIEGSKAPSTGPDTGDMRKQIENLQQEVDRLTKEDAALKAQVDSFSKAGATPSSETPPAH
ncbi:MAG TPA: HEAT repeat domain-containing protein, partial [Acidisoma sp.]|nr:HEAT repeat domain-containing protein [Acidisoma sp.]